MPRPLVDGEGKRNAYFAGPVRGPALDFCLAIHRDFAYAYGWLTPILVLLAMAAGLPRRALLLAVALLALYAIQTYLPTIADALPTLASLHAINALLVFWLAVQVARSVSAEAARWVRDRLMDGLAVPDGGRRRVLISREGSLFRRCENDAATFPC